MLDIIMDEKKDVLKVALKGRLDTTTTPELEQKLKGKIEDINELVFEISELDYISSAGLRVLLSAQKTMSGRGSMTVKGPQDAVKEIFDVTGFSEILTIENS